MHLQALYCADCVLVLLKLGKRGDYFEETDENLGRSKQITIPIGRTLDQSQILRPFCGFMAAVYGELAVDVADMCTHGRNTHHKLVGDLCDR